jgi:predicted O-methyltransferase YrrM
MDVILSEQEFYAFRKFSLIYEDNLKERKQLPTLKTGEILPVGKVPISSIARKSVLPEKFQHLLFKLVYQFKPETIVELGTSLGITTLYLAAPDSTAQVLSLEGNAQLISVASENINKAGIKNIQIIPGLFSESLPEILDTVDKLDFVFLDGDHRFESTVEYVKSMLPKLHADSVLVLDDIHWNPDMEKAWKVIQQIPRVTVTIDLYRLGLVFFRTGQVKQHFTLTY